MKSGSKVWPLHSGNKILQIFDLVTYFFYPTPPIFELVRDIIKINILSKFDEDWSKIMACINKRNEEATCFPPIRDNVYGNVIRNFTVFGMNYPLTLNERVISC